MKILIYSSSFYPNIGGLETVVLTLAREFVRRNHEVKLITETQYNGNDEFPFEVIRQPSFEQLTELTNWGQVCLHACISLKALRPFLRVRKKLFVTHQTWYRRMNGRTSWQDYIKLLVCRFTVNISISKAIADHIPAKSYIIPNAYRTDLFRRIPGTKRDKELIFLGRLVSDKGVDLLLDALKKIKNQGIDFKCTIAGDGPEKEKLLALCKQYNLENQVSFIGSITGEALTQLLNQHQILVVPSRWKEPFGIVALEGIACGCVVVASNGGGLPDAVGACGLTFENGNANQLAEKLAQLLTDRQQLSHYLKYADEHLKQHTAECISDAYLNVFEQQLSYSKT